jgi:hypothetical protein
MSDFIIQNFYQGQLVNAFNQEGMFTNSGQQIAAFSPKIPNISSGIGNISNNYGQIESTNQFNFNNGIFQFPNQVGPVGSVVQYTFASYVSTGTKTITVPTDGTTYYIVAELLTTIIDPGQYSTSVVILNTAMTLAAIEANTNKFLPICTIVGNAGVYTVSLNNNCAYNYGANNNIQSNFNRRVQIIFSGPVTSTLGLSFAFLLNDIVSTGQVVYNLPNVTTLPTGTTICLKNRSNTRMFVTGTPSILMNPANGNDYYKLETSPDGWIIEGQAFATYSPWATQAYVATQRYYSLLITSNTTWTCPANVTKIYVTLIGGGGSGGVPTFTNGNPGEATIAFGLTADGGNEGKGNGAGGVKFGCAPGGNGANAGTLSPGNPGNGGATWIGCGGGISGSPTIGGGGGGIASSVSSNNLPGGGGGSSGQLLFKKLVTVIPGTTYTISIGAGGPSFSSDASRAGANGAVLIEY